MTEHDLQPGAKGVWTFESFDHNGNLVESFMKENLITTAGKGQTLDRLFGLGAAVALTGMSVGTSGTAAAVGDTAITTPTFKVFDALPVRAGLVVTASTTYATTEANITIQEVGLLTASGSVLYNRLAPIGPFTKSTAVSLKVTVQLTQQ
jgi:hypothetical protein